MNFIDQLFFMNKNENTLLKIINKGFFIFNN